MKIEELKNLRKGMKVRIVGKRSDHWNPQGRMDIYMNTIMTVRSIDLGGNSVSFEEDQHIRYGGWCWQASDIAEILNKNIYITQDGATTHAILKQNGDVISRASARCNPDDTYDFKTGAMLAVKRLLGIVDDVEHTVEVPEPAQKEPKFDFGSFARGYQAVECATVEERTIFLAWLAGKGYRSVIGAPLIGYERDDAFLSVSTSHEKGRNLAMDKRTFCTDVQTDRKKGFEMIRFKPEMLAKF